jgi:hypothetical protein
LLLQVILRAGDKATVAAGSNERSKLTPAVAPMR